MSINQLIYLFVDEFIEFIFSFRTALSNMCIILKTIEKIGNIKSRYRLKLIDFVGKSFATQGLSQTQKKGF